MLRRGVRAEGQKEAGWGGSSAQVRPRGVHRGTSASHASLPSCRPTPFSWLCVSAQAPGGIMGESGWRNIKGPVGHSVSPAPQPGLNLKVTPACGASPASQVLLDVSRANTGRDGLRGLPQLTESLGGSYPELWSVHSHGRERERASRFSLEGGLVFRIPLRSTGIFLPH